MSKKGDIYMKVLGCAFVKDHNPRVNIGKIIVRIKVPGSHDIIGLCFDNIQAVDACMNALHKVRQEMTKDENVHPTLKGPTDGKTH